MSRLTAIRPKTDGLTGNYRALEDGIEWIVVRKLAPMQEELTHLRAFVLAVYDRLEPS